MFAGRYFDPRFFAPRYFPEHGASVGYGHTLYIATPSAAGDGVTVSAAGDIATSSAAGDAVTQSGGIG